MCKEGQFTPRRLSGCTLGDGRFLPVASISTSSDRSDSGSFSLGSGTAQQSLSVCGSKGWGQGYSRWTLCVTHGAGLAGGKECQTRSLIISNVDHR